MYQLSIFESHVGTPFHKITLHGLIKGEWVLLWSNY